VTHANLQITRTHGMPYYGHSLEEPNIDSDDLMDEVDGLGNEFDALEQELIRKLENSKNEGDEDDIYCYASL
jgi:hypothetical protein